MNPGQYTGAIIRRYFYSQLKNKTFLEEAGISSIDKDGNYKPLSEVMEEIANSLNKPSKEHKERN